MDYDMNEEQELAALEAELMALEAEVETQAHAEPERYEPAPEPAAEAPKPKAKKKNPKASEVTAAKPEDPKAAAIRQYGAQRLASMRASRGLL